MATKIRVICKAEVSTPDDAEENCVVEVWANSRPQAREAVIKEQWIEFSVFACVGYYDSDGSYHTYTKRKSVRVVEDLENVFGYKIEDLPVEHVVVPRPKRKETNRASRLLDIGMSEEDVAEMLATQEAVKEQKREERKALRREL